MALPVPITRRELIDPEGAHCDRMRTHLRARLMLVAELGCRGKIGSNQAPGYAVGLKAAAELLDRYDPKPRARDDEPAGRPVAVNIILTGAAGHAGPQLQTHGVRLHLSGHNGDSA